MLRAARCGTVYDKGECARRDALLPALLEAVERRLPEHTAWELGTVLSALVRLNRLERPLLQRVDGFFEAALRKREETLSLGCMASMLNACSVSGYQARSQTMELIAGWLTDAAAADAAEGEKLWLGPPVSAAVLLCAWANMGRNFALPMTVLTALAGSAVPGAGIPDVRGGFSGRLLSQSLYALACLVKKAGGDACGEGEGPLQGMHSGISQWAGMAVARIQAGKRHSDADLGWAVWALGVLRGAPDPATAAAAVANVVALASMLPRAAVVPFAKQVSMSLAEWERRGLVSWAPAAQALSAQVPRLSAPDKFELRTHLQDVLAVWPPRRAHVQRGASASFAE